MFEVAFLETDAFNLDCIGFRWILGILMICYVLYNFHELCYRGKSGVVKVLISLSMRNWLWNWIKGNLFPCNIFYFYFCDINFRLNLMNWKLLRARTTLNFDSAINEFVLSTIGQSSVSKHHQLTSIWFCQK